MYEFERASFRHFMLCKGAYRWVNIIRHTFSGGGSAGLSEEDFFTDLVQNPVYHNSLLSADSWQYDAKSVHGPYSIDRLPTQVYRRLSQSQFKDRVMQVVNRPELYPPDEEGVEQVIRFLELLPEQAWLYELTHVHDATMFQDPEFKMDHELSFVLSEFIEFVIVDIVKREVIVMVIGID